MASLPSADEAASRALHEPLLSSEPGVSHGRADSDVLQGKTPARPREAAVAQNSNSETEPTPGAPSLLRGYMESLAEKLGLESAEEGRVCFWLGLQAHLANTVFTIGRNVGPTLFIAKVGTGQLPAVMFASGISVLAAGPLFVEFSRGKRAARVNRDFGLFSALIFLLMPLPLAISEKGSFLGLCCAYILFLAEDLLPMLLMMQSSSLAQSSLTGHAAKRLLGLIQLGCSTGAMTAGLTIGAAWHN